MSPHTGLATILALAGLASCQYPYGRPNIVGYNTGDGTSVVISEINGGSYPDGSFSIGHGKDSGSGIEGQWTPAVVGVHSSDSTSIAIDSISGGSYPVQSYSIGHGSNYYPGKPVKAQNGEVVIGSLTRGSFGRGAFSVGEPGRSVGGGRGGFGGGSVTDRRFVPGGVHGSNYPLVGGNTFRNIPKKTPQHAGNRRTPGKTVKAQNGEVVIGSLTGGSFGQGAFSVGEPGRSIGGGRGGQGAAQGGINRYNCHYISKGQYINGLWNYVCRNGFCRWVCKQKLTNPQFRRPQPNYNYYWQNYVHQWPNYYPSYSNQYWSGNQYYRSWPYNQNYYNYNTYPTQQWPGQHYYYGDPWYYNSRYNSY